MKKSGKKLLSVIVAMALVLTLLPQATTAADIVVDYIDAGGVQQTTTVTQITASTAALSGGWYVADTDVTISQTLAVDGDTHLILADGATLTVTGSDYDAGIRVRVGNSLTIYGQTNGSGVLNAAGGYYGAGIGGGEGCSGGNITINGGTVTATGISGAGIGGGSGGSGGNITINGGTVTAESNHSSAGIGGGWNGDGGTVVITGGSVKAAGGFYAGAEDIGHGDGGSDSGTLTNGSGNGDAPVYLTTVTLQGAGAAAVSALTTDTSYAYGINGVKTDGGGRLYLYLPDATTTTAAETVSDSFAGSVTTTTDPATSKGTLNTLYPFVVTGGTPGTDYTYAGGVLAFNDTEPGGFTVSMRPGVISTTLGRIAVNAGTAGDPVDITLSGVDIDVSKTDDACAFELQGASFVSLTLDGKNKLKSGNIKAGLQVSEDTSAVINGPGSLQATSVESGAGIGGGGNDKNGGAITINGGTITAISGGDTAGIGAGIGGGRSGEGGTITINGGIVTATSIAGAGIGGGFGGSGGIITINGGTVTATGSLGAGIGGGGESGSDGAITISGGTVTATSNHSAAGIGGGRYGNGGTVVITGGSVKAEGGWYPDTEDIGHGDGGTGSGTLTNGPVNGDVPVSLTTVTLESVSTATAVSSLTTNVGYDYSVNDMYTDTSGKLYLYLSDTTVTSTVQADGNVYSGSVTTTTDEATSLGTLYLSRVLTVSPSGAGTSVSGNIEITFSLDMDTTIDGAVSLDGGSTSLSGAWSDNKTYTAPYSALSYGILYNVSISGFKDINGNTVPDATGSFTTAADIYPPALTGVSPSGTGTPLAGNLEITFSEVMDTSTAGTVSLDGSNTYLAGGSWSGGDTKYTVSYSGLSYDTQYTVIISGFRDAARNEMTADNSNSFTTAAYPYHNDSSSSDDKTETEISTSGNTTTVTVTIEAGLDSDGILDISIDEDIIIEAVEKALEEASKNGADNIVLEIIVRGTNTASGVTLNITADALGSMTNGVVSLLKISTPLGYFLFDAETLRLIDGQAEDDISIYVTTVDISTLSIEAQATIGDRPVYDFTVTSGGTVISDFGGGTVTVSLPYTPAEEEDPDKIVIYYISNSGELVMVPNCAYDAVKGMVIFTTDHFSTYAVAYNDVSFTDVSGWYEEYVDFLAARETIKGTGDGKFSPGSNMTRAQIVTMLYRLSGVDGIYVNLFSDVASGAWYEQAAAWASENGITSGVGGCCFAPENEISREQMIVMLYNYAQYKGIDVSVGEDTNILSYNDAFTISDYAYPALQWACGAGIIEGDDEGNLNPAGSASRAQVAKIITVFIQGTL